MTVAGKIKALRSALDLTQVGVVERSGGLLTQDQVAKVETGKNKASSYDVRAGFARAFGVTMSDLDAFLAGGINLEEIVTRAVVPVPRPGELVHSVPVDVQPIGDDETPLEIALVAAMAREPGVFKMADLDLARRVVRETHRYAVEDYDQVEIALDLLRATKAERSASEVPSVLGVVSRWIYGKLDASQRARAEQRAREATDEARQRAIDTGMGNPDDFPPVTRPKK